MIEKETGHGEEKHQDAPLPVPANMRRMNEPDGSASVKGLCGDSMEMYLVINEETVTDASFFTDGCSASQACGSTAARLAVGKTLKEVLRLSPADVLDAWANIPQGNVHCAILAISTLHKALADYLLKFQNG
ncbi:MAG: iron-sulfur cluster assembly scaffold protein [Chitinispirillaceae bacterium]|nr:iron-sulfur cluster assembly scaffold protein [Chitinispirillaceae bacterium]